MTEDRAMHMFIRGEIRTDGWKSDWRKDFEEYLKVKPSSQIPRVATQAKASGKRTYTQRGQGMKNCEYMRKRRAAATKAGNCTDCYKVKARKGKTTCQPCQDKRNARTMKRYYAKKAA